MEHQNLSVTASVALAISLSTVVAASEKDEERAKPASPTKLEASVTTLKSLSPDEVKDFIVCERYIHDLHHFEVQS